jgi:hypothetical protein
MANAAAAIPRLIMPVSPDTGRTLLGDLDPRHYRMRAADDPRVDVSARTPLRRRAPPKGVMLDIECRITRHNVVKQ